ncbi:hypothetical protein BH11ARM2_BH11ARM2_07110 [soil metagenome]
MLNLRVSSLLGVLALTASMAQAQTQAPTANASYVLGPEDVITVNVVDQLKFSGDFIVPDTGVLTFPGVGDVKVAGMTISALQITITQKLKQRLLKPEVVVTLKLARPKRLYVFGDVRTPGIFEAKPGWGIQESLSAAGGLNLGVQNQDVTVIIERAGTGERIQLPLTEALAQSAANRLKINPGDVVRFQAVSQTPVYVTGSVKTPGLIRLREGETGVIEAITQSGGMNPDADLKNVRIMHLNGTQETVNLVPTLVRGEPAKLPNLQPGDLLVVPEIREKFVILGFVNQQGYYPIPSGQTYTLSQAVAIASGSNSKARLSRVGMIRMENGKEVSRVYDLGKFLKSGDSTMNPVVQPGDVIYVPENNTISTTTILASLGAAAVIYRSLGR